MMVQAQPQYKRVYVQVDVESSPEGRMLPRALVWQDGKRYEIDRELDIRPAHAEKAGGQGDRYKVKMKGLERQLFFEHNTNTSSSVIGRWFVEGRA